MNKMPTDILIPYECGHIYNERSKEVFRHQEYMPAMTVRRKGSCPWCIRNEYEPHFRVSQREDKDEK